MVQYELKKLRTPKRDGGCWYVEEYDTSTRYSDMLIYFFCSAGEAIEVFHRIRPTETLHIPPNFND